MDVKNGVLTEKKIQPFSTQNFAPVTLFSGKKTSTNPKHLCKEFSCGFQPEALQQALSACSSNSVCMVKEYERMEWGRMGWKFLRGCSGVVLAD